MSFAARHRFILSLTVGSHGTQTAVLLLLRTIKCLAHTVLLWVSDGWDAYSEALLILFHTIVKFESTGRVGRPKAPKVVPLPQLRYAQVVKERQGNRVIRLTKQVVYGDADQIDPKEISTSLIERQNLSLRQQNERLTRKTIAFSKKEQELQKQMDFFRCYHNFVRCHRSLRERTDEVVTGKVRRRWHKRTPAMSIGLTDHIWSLRELMSFKTPSHCQ